MNPVAFTIGPIPVYWYGITIVSAAIAGAWVAATEAKRRGLDPEEVWNGLIVALIMGIIGARLYHVFSSPVGGSVGWSYYRQNPLAILKIWEGGLGIYGAIIGGVIGVLLYCWVRKFKPLEWLDVGAPGLALAQVIGRWGNFVNQELYGPPTDLPWGIRIPLENRYLEHRELPPETRFHPVFLYESLWSLIGFALLMWIGRRFKDRLRKGDIFLLYLVWYPLGRFLIEFLRPDAWMLGPLAAAQVFALIAIALAILGIIYLHRRPLPAAEMGTLEEATGPDQISLSAHSEDQERENETTPE
ncbi:MAG: prolipoprotein diacylglyceryl transferase [Anaerolineae bacterium]|nr:MAG: prolipoprotein diacylglyceryl transferase [Anaerolineae bacterium]